MLKTDRISMLKLLQIIENILNLRGFQKRRVKRGISLSESIY